MRPLSRHPSFTLYWTGETAFVLAYQMLLVAIGWQIYELTDSALSLGLVGLAHFGAQLACALPAGAAADRHDRRRIALITQWLQAVVAGVLAVGSHQGWLTAEWIYAGSFVIGVATTFHSPALRSLLPGLVGRDALPQAIAWSGATRKAAVIVGPALGGVLYFAGATAVYLLSALTFVAAGFLLVRLPAPPARKREALDLATLLGGVRYIWSRPVILGATSLDLFAMLLGGATALLPIYARDILQTGPWGLGMLRAAPGVGAVLASVYLVRRPLQRHAGRIMYGAVAAFGLATIIFGLSTNLVLSLAALAILGAGDMVSVVIRSALIQLETPDEMRGRVSAVNSLFVGTSNQLGQFESGITAAWWGAVPAVVVGGIGTILVVVLWARWFPALWQRDRIAPH